MSETTQKAPAKVGDRCCANLRGGDRWHKAQCAKKSTVVVNGWAYCGLHDPARVKVRREARNEEWNRKYQAQSAVREKQKAEAAEQKRRADCFDDLLAVAQRIVNYCQHQTGQLTHICAEAEAAINKATT